jgi:hypothetical protein
VTSHATPRSIDPARDGIYGRRAVTARVRCRSSIAGALAIVLAATAASGHEGHATGPHPTDTPAAAASPAALGSVAATKSGAPIPVLFRVRPGARADLGWTGISHGQPWPAEQRLGFALDCSAGGTRCPALGGAPGDFFGAPIPLSSGGVPACIVNRLRTGVGGSVDTKSGCGELSLHLTASIFLGEEVARPCPVCRGDATANDGTRGGTCAGGATPGAACDAQSAGAFGATSNDCAPNPGKNAGDLTIDVAPLTTGGVELAPTLKCKAVTEKDAGRCHCAAQAQPSACVGTPCDAAGRCTDGPIDGACDGAPWRGCLPGTGRANCEDVEPGSGECQVSLRQCFGGTITASGACDPERPTYVGVFCTPQTRAAALNSAAGLPGPARLVLPLERVAVPARP